MADVLSVSKIIKDKSKFRDYEHLRTYWRDMVCIRSLTHRDRYYMYRALKINYPFDLMYNFYNYTSKCHSLFVDEVVSRRATS